MDEEAFVKLFWDVLNNRIPSESRDQIKAYWEGFQVTPQLCLSDEQISKIESSHGSSIRIAAVCGTGLSIFAFRLSLLSAAPESVLQTTIQHELIHVLFRSGGAPPSIKKFERSWLNWAAAVFRINEITAQLKQQVSNHLALAHEHLVSKTNKMWGGNEAEVHAWVEQRRKSLGFAVSCSSVIITTETTTSSISDRIYLSKKTPVVMEKTPVVIFMFGGMCAGLLAGLAGTCMSGNVVCLRFGPLLGALLGLFIALSKGRLRKC